MTCVIPPLCAIPPMPPAYRPHRPAHCDERRSGCGIREWMGVEAACWTHLRASPSEASKRGEETTGIAQFPLSACNPESNAHGHAPVCCSVSLTVFGTSAKANRTFPKLQLIEPKARTQSNDRNIKDSDSAIHGSSNSLRATSCHRSLSLSLSPSPCR